MGKKAKEVRSLEHETQDQFRRRFNRKGTEGVSQVLISQWETGVVPIPVWALVKYGNIAIPFSKELSVWFWQAAGLDFPEPVTEPLGNEPVGGEPTALKGLSKTVNEFYARNPVLPPVEPVTGEVQSPAPAKKTKHRKRGEGQK
jgi:hypothetical protein